VFCVILSYAIACPLITRIAVTPIFLLYRCICLFSFIFLRFNLEVDETRAVDKYNLIFVNDTKIADKSVHRLAENFTIIALIIQQLTLLFFRSCSYWFMKNFHCLYFI